ncbi:hypothetical protein [Actinomadura kijaniata]|uniref:hypothetical protein n=1 Tax=Actinomadura kijaniata TaxID=46161 RepID=UPI0008296A32|nr:hypothetical protein [Actinomadura kijaniata]
MVGELIGVIIVLGFLGLVVRAEWMIITGHENAGDTVERVWGGVIYFFLGLGALGGLLQLMFGSSTREADSRGGVEFGLGDGDDDPGG